MWFCHSDIIVGGHCKKTRKFMEQIISPND
jgi:hypothetical protein